MTFIIGTPHSHHAGYYSAHTRWDTSEMRDDVQTCPHCQAVILMRTWGEHGGWCSKCAAPICNNPLCVAETARLGCVPFTKKLEAFIESQLSLKQHLKIAGLEPSPIPQSIIVP